MADCKISIPLTKAPDVVIEAVRKRVLDQKGTFSGDTAKGQFSVSVPVMGKIAGTYTIPAKSLDITITDKPMLLPCGKIETWLKAQFGA
jgi:hypothetical protein